MPAGKIKFNCVGSVKGLLKGKNKNESSINGIYLKKINNPIFTVMLINKLRSLSVLFKFFVIKFFDIVKSKEALKSKGIMNHGWLKP